MVACLNTGSSSAKLKEEGKKGKKFVHLKVTEGVEWKLSSPAPLSVSRSPEMGVLSQGPGLWSGLAEPDNPDG